MKKIIDKEELRRMILAKEDISRVDYSLLKDMDELLKDTDIEEIPYIEMSQATTAKKMFYGCKKLKRVPELDVRNIEDAQWMFGYCWELEEASELNFENASNIVGLFGQCRKIKRIKGIRAPKAELLLMTFMNCYEMEEIGELSCKTARLMNETFKNCRNLRKIKKIEAPGVLNFIKSFRGCGMLDGELASLEVNNKATLENMFDTPEELVGAFGAEKTKKLIIQLGDFDAFAAKAILAAPESHLERLVGRELLKNGEYFE